MELFFIFTCTNAITNMKIQSPGYVKTSLQQRLCFNQRKLYGSRGNVSCFYLTYVLFLSFMTCDILFV
jgi:hypothetical protein